jgi:hypothetical protein
MPVLVSVYLCAIVHFVSLSSDGSFFEGTKYIKINLNINLMGKRGKRMKESIKWNENNFLFEGQG